MIRWYEKSAHRTLCSLTIWISINNQALGFGLTGCGGLGLAGL
jgi:hypothetical protein